jgi:hypothetical protein
VKATVELTFEQMRTAVKSISRSMDVETRKLERSRPGTPVYNDAQRAYQVLDDIEEAIRTAMRGLVDDMAHDAYVADYEERHP